MVSENRAKMPTCQFQRDKKAILSVHLDRMTSIPQTHSLYQSIFKGEKINN